MGGLTVTRSNLAPLALSRTNSHAAFSASVLDARYATAGLSWMSSMVTGFQEASLKVVAGSVTLAASRMAAKDEVTTTRRTEGADRAMALRTPVVPMTAGSMRSFLGSAVAEGGVGQQVFRSCAGRERTGSLLPWGAQTYLS